YDSAPSTTWIFLKLYNSHNPAESLPMLISLQKPFKLDVMGNGIDSEGTIDLTAQGRRRSLLKDDNPTRMIGIEESPRALNLSTSGYVQCQGYAVFAHPLRTSQVVGFTIEGYIAICHPFRAPIICTKRNARLAVLFILCVNFALNFPKWFAFSYELKWDPCTASGVDP
ncbi:uncharacterized protein LOC135483030, partial [Lineus longissimus]|uniref:uncharacterized protein LOC135483030 n=1 Tax=Lineus longissimus TaxID=88925 RepID=UPI00315CC5ED